MKAVVTGGAGFIGSALVARLRAMDPTGHVVVLDDFSVGSPERIVDDPAVAVVEGSVLDRGLLDVALAGAEVVVHLAALTSVPASVTAPRRYHEVNASGTWEVLDAARRAGGPYCLVASSAAVYGDAPPLPSHEGLPVRPTSPYAASKVAAEAHAAVAQACYGLPVLCLRLFNVFGPGQHAGGPSSPVIPAFLEAALASRPLEVHGSGEQTRDFVDVDTVVDVLVAAMRRRVASPVPVNVASGSPTSLRQLVSTLGGLGLPVDVVAAPERPGDVAHSCGEVTRLRRLFPEIEPRRFVDGLAATLRWFELSR